MANMLDLEHFFSLGDFAHKELWQEDKPVWHPLHLLKEYLFQKPPRSIEIPIPEGVFLKNPETISIGKGTVIEPGAYIQGPCVIGKNCVISHCAYVRPFVILGDGCHLGHASEIKGSILLDGAKATHFVYVGDSILGRDVNLGAGVKCANLRLDHKEICCSYQEKKIPTGLKKFGAIVGDRTQIGCNSVLNPGTLVGKEHFFYPLTCLKGVYLHQSREESLCHLQRLEKK